MSGEKRKIAILGGGAGALATAFELSSLPNWKDRFDITIYQLGWRLGGKGASGRNREHCNRIEEHGIHLWLGYYENAFGVIQRCYAENARPLSAPLATWEEAFKPINCHVMEEQIDGKAEFWPVHFAPAAGNPGDGKVPTHWEALCLALDGLRAMFSSAAALPGNAEAPGMFSGWGKFLAGILEASVLEAGEVLLGALCKLARALDGTEVGELINKIEEFVQWLWGKLEKHFVENSDARHFWYLMDFGFANLRGYLADDVKNKGFDSLNNIDYREWLHKHGASEITLHSPAVNWAYNFMLHDRSTLAAGVMLHVASRALLSCKGAIYWKMQAGMGDVVFAPLYEVLRTRGVKFEFFLRVKKLSLSEDGNSVAEIQLGRQATVKRDEYDPLFKVKGLPCWPSEPLYEQLVEGEELKKRDINLESYWTPWEDVAEVRLKKDAEFTDVVLGISLAGVPAICGELIAAKPAWKNMVEKITTTPTQAFQVWTYPDASGLGWPAWRMPVAVALTSSEPINSWADMSDIILREEWTGDLSPNHIGYLCGVMEAGEMPPPTDHEYPARELEKVRETAIDCLQKRTKGLWPNANKGGGFDWDLLVDAATESGEARLESQYLRVNIDPSERYVLSAAGTIEYRMDPENTGVSNLFLAGDWVKTPMNVGSVEAAVMGGRMAARAISKQPIEIPGEDFAHPERARKAVGAAR
ncbi:MAG TPA: NAD(P)-binding protein [Terriglobales bacterium]|nr:NAD(P)-binding protein [Terriglobales bacterium]